MEIKRIGENKIRCALTEHEIKDMGFDIDEIIGNGETTQKFMRIVLNMVEEQENINLEHISPMVRAELMPDHSMNITFGGGPELDIEELIDTVSSLIGQMAPERLEELRRLNTAEEEKKQTEQKDQLMVCALRFAALEEASQMCKACFKEKLPKSALYRLKDRYYLILDFSDFEKQEMSPFAFSAMEYDDGHISEDVQIAFIVEHGSLIVKNQAVEMLMQL